MSIKTFTVTKKSIQIFTIDTEKFQRYADINNMLDGYDSFDCNDVDHLLEFLSVDYVEASYTNDILVGQTDKNTPIDEVTYEIEDKE